MIVGASGETARRPGSVLRDVLYRGSPYSRGWRPALSVGGRALQTTVYNEADTLTHLGDIHCAAGDPDVAGTAADALAIFRRLTIGSR